MKVVTEDTQSAVSTERPIANGMMRVYNKLNGSSVDVHAVDAREYVKRLPHLWSLSPVAPEQAKAEDAEIVTEPAKEEVAEKTAEVEAPATSEDKPVSARSRKLAKFED